MNFYLIYDPFSNLKLEQMSNRINSYRDYYDGIRETQLLRRFKSVQNVFIANKFAQFTFLKVSITDKIRFFLKSVILIHIFLFFFSKLKYFLYLAARTSLGHAHIRLQVEVSKNSFALNKNASRFFT